MKFFKKYLAEKKNVDDIELSNEVTSDSEATSTNTNGVFDCPQCMEVFSSFNFFRKHLSMHEKESILNSS